MSWSFGLVGLPNAGKSSLFKALTSRNVTIENYPFSTVDPNKAIVPLPDQRLIDLAALNGSTKITPAVVEITDVAGLVEGASRGEGLGNKFLGHLRSTDLLIHIVALYDLADADFAQAQDRQTVVNLELLLADLEVIRRRREKLEPKLKGPERDAAQNELQLLAKVEAELDRGQPLRSLSLNDEEWQTLDALDLLTRKAMVYVYNLSENQDTDNLPRFEEEPAFGLCAALEAELADLPAEDKAEFFEAYGMQESRTGLLLNKCYNLLNLITFYTIKGEEARAWVIPAGIRAIAAAGKVHSDIARGFINAEVFNATKLLTAGNVQQARETGHSRIEGRDYQVNDGDVLFFRFRS